MTFSDFEKQLLVGTYLLTEQTGKDMVRAGDVVETYGLEWRKGWIYRAVEGFIAVGWSGDARTISDEPDQDIWLNAAGYRRAEELLPYTKLKARVESFVSPAVPTAAIVPASDRIVSINHNEPNVRKAIADAEKLVLDLQTNNDVGTLSPEALPVAVREVSDIVEGLKSSAVRIPDFGDRVKSTLGWIGKEAAGALVGAAALALLALIGTIFGSLL